MGFCKQSMVSKGIFFSLLFWCATFSASSWGCENLNLKSHDLYMIFANESKFTDYKNETGNDYLFSVIKDPKDKYHYIQYQNTLVFLSKSNNELATILLAALWIDTMKIHNCKKAKEHLKKITYQTKNIRLRKNLEKLIGVSHAKKNIKNVMNLQTSENKHSIIEERPQDQVAPTEKSLLIIFEDSATATISKK